MIPSHDHKSNFNTKEKIKENQKDKDQSKEIDYESRIVDFKNDKIEENITSMIHNVMEFDDEDNTIENNNSCQNQENTNEIVSLEGSFLSKSMDSINEISITKSDKMNKSDGEIDPNSIILNASQEFFQKEYLRKVKNSPKKQNFSLINFDSSYSDNNSFADDIKKIPTSKQSKSTFFQNQKPNRDSSRFFNQNNSKGSIIFEGVSKNTNFTHTQDQLIFFNSDAESQSQNNSNLILGQNIFNNSHNSQNHQPSNYKNKSNKKLQNPIKKQSFNSVVSQNPTNYSYNLNSTAQSANKRSHFVPENVFSKEQNLSNLSYNK